MGKISEEERACREFMNGWKAKDLNRMFKACTKTFQERQVRENLKIRMSLGSSLGLVSYTVLKEEVFKGVVADFELKVNVGGIKKLAKVRLIKEKTAFTPDIKGDWGVNPVSFRFEEIKKGK